MKTKKILYLDATLVNFLLMKAAFKDLNVELINLVDHDEIKEILKKEAFDLIVSNTYMIPGEEIIRNLRQGVYGDINKETLAIAYTVVYFFNEEEKCLNAGFNEYLLMPSPVGIIKEKIEKMLK